MLLFLSRVGISLLTIFNPVAHAFGGEYVVTITNDGPAVRGANITFNAELKRADGQIPTEEYKYRWKDNLFPQHTAEFLSNATCKWTVHYSAHKYRKSGLHLVNVEVFTKTFIIDWPLCQDYQQFELTDKLNGNLTLLQDNILIPTTKSHDYVSNSSEVLHEVLLTTPDFKYIHQNSSSITTYWYVDCELVGKTNGLIFRHNYSQSDIDHTIMALVVTNLTLSNSSLNKIQQLPNEPPSNGTSTEITTSSDVLLNTISDSSSHNKFSYEVFGNISVMGVSFDCQKEKVIIDQSTNGTYGLFSQKVRVIAPVANVTTDGNRWIQHWDMLNLTITCQGSPPFKSCYKIIPGYYNATGNETCEFEDILETCAFTVPRYFLDSIHYSVLLIIRNDINKVVRSIGIDVYEVTKQPQLSVIVVPISAAIVAVVLIIFGIAYYIQSRNRFMIEVADFDFSTNASDMEYKTFRERLVEAFHNAFDKTEDFYEQDVTNTAPTNKKYGSMP